MSDSVFRIVGGSIYVHSVNPSGGSIYVNGGQTGAGLLKDGWKKLKNISKGLIKELKGKAMEEGRKQIQNQANKLVDKYIPEKREYIEKEIMPELRKSRFGYLTQGGTIGLGIEGDEEFTNSFRKVVKARSLKPKRVMSEAQLENLRRGRMIRAEKLALKKSLQN